jgi:hypothetical protein
MQGVTEGVVDFVSRRAITRSVNAGSGGTARRLPGGKNDKAPAIYMLFDGTSVSACLLGQWRNPRPCGAAGSYRGPRELRFLDLMRPESIVEAAAEGEEDVRGQTATRYRLRLDADRIQWPEGDSDAPRPPVRAMVGRLLSKALPDPTPTGILRAEVWVDSTGRLVRYHHNDVAEDHPKHNQAPWTTTELWNFGLPPPLHDRTTQPVIDPRTLQFPESEAELIRSTKPRGDAPNL